MMYRGFLTSTLLCFSGMAWSQQYEDNVALIKTAESKLTLSLANEYPSVAPGNIKLQITPIDPRTRLSRCDGNINQTIASQRPLGNNLSLKLQCAGSRPWTLYIPAKVDTLATVAVLTKNLDRGKLLTQNDFALTLMNTAQLGFGYLGDPQQIVGMELKRRLPVGSAIRLSHLKTPEAVSKGDKVMLEAGVTGVTVVTDARALSAGKIGQQIQVMNIRSSRVIDAEVVAPGRVRVIM